MSTDTSPDLPPPRFVMDGGRRRLVTDEQERFARPCTWALDLLDHDTRWERQKYPNAEPCRRAAGAARATDSGNRVAARVVLMPG